jgi:hypothetical protein
MTVDELNKYIDDYIELFKKSKTITDLELRNRTIILHYNTNILDAVKKSFVELGIATIGKDIDGDTWTITQKGERIIKLGSWQDYLNDQEERERLILQQINSSIRANESSILTNESVRTTNKWQLVILSCTLIVAILGITKKCSCTSKQFNTKANKSYENVDTLQVPIKMKTDSSNSVNN